MLCYVMYLRGKGGLSYEKAGGGGGLVLVVSHRFSGVNHRFLSHLEWSRQNAIFSCQGIF